MRGARAEGKKKKESFFKVFSSLQGVSADLGKSCSLPGVEDAPFQGQGAPSSDHRAAHRAGNRERLGDASQLLFCAASPDREGIERHKSLGAVLEEKVPFVGCKLCHPRDEVVIIILITWLYGLLVFGFWGFFKCLTPLTHSAFLLELISTFPAVDQLGVSPSQSWILFFPGWSLCCALRPGAASKALGHERKTCPKHPWGQGTWGFGEQSPSSLSC